MNIHSTAIIDSSAEIDASVVIGPYTIVKANTTIGSDTVINSHVEIGPNTKIGRNCEIHANAVVGGDPQDKKFQKQNKSFLEIGDFNVIRECATLNRGTDEGSYTRVGSNCLFMAYSHVAHNCEVGSNVIMANSVALAGHVVVDDHAIIGGLSGVHQFCRIGRLAIVGGCSKVVQDIPPFMMSDGNPTVVCGINSIGLKRNKISYDQIKKIKTIYQILFRKKRNLSHAINEIQELNLNSEMIDELIKFIQSSDRGIGY